ncbi:MAG TPA: hypothetical protein VK308_17240 [Pyrinomonadaceae bacterium]|nr:hypothetical protein [Pyrinomonadaceae bacterium]
MIRNKNAGAASVVNPIAIMSHRQSGAPRLKYRDLWRLIETACERSFSFLRAGKF